MKKVLILLLVLCSGVSGAYAQSGPGFSGISSDKTFHYPGYVRSGSGRLVYVHRNANSCAPDMPQAVWVPSSELLGYRCFNSSNGS